jgi:hypothetical protein
MQCNAHLSLVQNCVEHLLVHEFHPIFVNLAIGRPTPTTPHNAEVSKYIRFNSAATQFDSSRPLNISDSSIVLACNKACMHFVHASLRFWVRTCVHVRARPSIRVSSSMKYKPSASPIKDTNLFKTPPKPITVISSSFLT